MKDGRSASHPFCSSQEWREPKVILPSAGFHPVKDGSVLERRLPAPGGQLTAMAYAAREMHPRGSQVGPETAHLKSPGDSVIKNRSQQSFHH